MSELTIKDFEEMILELQVQSDAKAKIKKLDQEQGAVVETLKKKILAALDQLGKTSYKSDVGMVSKKVRVSWKTPKEDFQREAYRDFLTERGEFDSMWTIHSASMNAHCKALYEDAVAKKDMEFEIPGLDEPTTSETISLTKR